MGINRRYFEAFIQYGLKEIQPVLKRATSRMVLTLFINISVLVNESKAQISGVPDTLAYLNTIVSRKAEFVGRPFSILMDSLKIQIKYFSPFAGIHYNKNKETSTSFGFYYPQNAEEMYLTYPHLEIYWQPYLDASFSSTLFDNFNGGPLPPAFYSFYGSGIVADIKVLE